jgi:prepilin-type N-terminal cleavage/methylation domain-containing protein
MKTIRAFTPIEIIIAVAIIGMLAAVAIPSIGHAITDAHKKTCILNLKSIEGVKIRRAADCKKAETETPTDTDLFGPAGYIEKWPECPKGATCHLNGVNAKPACTAAGHAL